MFANYDFPDTDREATEAKVFNENTEDAASVPVEGKEADDCEELDESIKSNEQ